ncbi:molybdenum cofactor guanylyltransferase [Cetobacterium somerae]|uniref:molybdenum cofactor guanylyltransferase n=1 Tax=Cetobacterium sp. NK01 TaxID=2993530 RepID=UPI002116C4D4|nr:molybdenum cofactor guanylyltransferase [Cetobacterium sp. NK01]MCQ8212924.1 molybdenum cofactor guanylyltransferase [Cetobacterium sp. NK01]
MKYDKSVVLLAGGKGSRLNYIDKSFLKFNGKTFVEIIIEKLSKFSEIIIISNSPEKYLGYNLKVIKDEIKNVGPLGGILTGLKNATNEECLILSCDTPFLEEEFLEYLGRFKGDYDISIPIHNSFREPLCALYKKSSMDEIINCINNKEFKIANIFKNLKINWININEFENFNKISSSFFNINTFEDLKLMEKM